MPILTKEQIQADLDEILTEVGYQVGDAPFEDGGRGEVGATAYMVTSTAKAQKLIVVWTTDETC